MSKSGISLEGKPVLKLRKKVIIYLKILVQVVINTMNHKRICVKQQFFNKLKDK